MIKLSHILKDGVFVPISRQDALTVTAQIAAPSETQTVSEDLQYDFQFTDGPGGYIYCDPETGADKIKNAVSMHLYSIFQNKARGRQLEDILHQAERKYKTMLGFYMSGHESRPNPLLDGMRVIAIMNISHALLFEIAGSLAATVARGFTYATPLDSKGRLFQVDASGTATPVNPSLMIHKAPPMGGGRGFTGDTLTAKIIMSVDVNSRNNWRKITKLPSGQEIHEHPPLTMDILKQSLSGWAKTLTQRMNKNHDINGLANEKKLKIHIEPAGKGGYIEMGDDSYGPSGLGTVEREQSFVVNIFNASRDEVQAFSQALAKKFNQYSVLVVYNKGAGETPSSGLVPQGF